MNKFKVQAFFAEFPFLMTGDGPIVRNPEEVEEVAVSRIDKDFLGKEPQYDGASGSMVGIDDSERIYLFDQDGNLLVEVEQGGCCYHNEAYTEDESWDGETVGEALLRTDPAQVHYAVVVCTGYEIRDHYSVGGYSVTVCKPPKGFTLPEWVEEQKRRASEQIAATIAEIDAEA
ncbi:MAG: hypothetical protein HY454_02815 [Parcubacteria group bacterium]|nr:hypothetical protein [Parcubacteria group bacterium]